MDNIEEIIQRKAQALESKLVGLKHDFHQHPELGYQEFRTQEKIMQYLGELGIQNVQKIEETGVLALLRGTEPGPTVAIKGSIDGLATQDLTDGPDKSAHDGVAHACGHDGIIATLLGVATVSTRLIEQGTPFPGKLLFYFEPNEERTDPRTPFLNSMHARVFDGIDYMLSIHPFPLFDTGTYLAQRGMMNCGSGRFTIKITGKGGHAGKPGVPNPIIAAQKLVALIAKEYHERIELDAGEFVFVNTTGIASSPGPVNSVPEHVSIKGTVRIKVPDYDIYDAKIAEVRSFFDTIANRLPMDLRNTFEYEVVYDQGTPPNYNDPELTEKAHEICRLFGYNVIERQIYGGNPLGHIAMKGVPCCYVLFGSSTSDIKSMGRDRLHAPDFTLDPASITPTTAVMTALAYRALTHSKAASVGTTR